MEDEDGFVCVLIGKKFYFIFIFFIKKNKKMIDEVESLTAARKSALSGLEPSDALRVVNALLTQIDAFRFKKNVKLLFYKFFEKKIYKIRY